ncbi:unnamed protein product, partial [Prorocentrum cordatum]
MAFRYSLAAAGGAQEASAGPRGAGAARGGDGAASAPQRPPAELAVGATLEGTIRRAGSGFAIELGYEKIG